MIAYWLKKGPQSAGNCIIMKDAVILVT